MAEEWGRGLIRSWNTAGWFDLPGRLEVRVAAMDLRINGTMYVPLPDPASLQVMAREVGSRAAKQAVQGGVEDALRRGLGDLLNRDKKE